jgi:hypothetical protein
MHHIGHNGGEDRQKRRRDMSSVWKTKYGPRRVRHEPPALEEAIVAASGLTDSPQEQVEIAASLMNLPTEQVQAEMLKLGARRKPAHTVAFTGRAGAQRSVMVEHKTRRRFAGSRSFG